MTRCLFMYSFTDKKEKKNSECSLCAVLLQTWKCLDKMALCFSERRDMHSRNGE